MGSDTPNGNNGKTKVAVWRGKVDQMLEDIRGDVGYIREEIGRIAYRVEENTRGVSEQRTLCNERMKNIDNSLKEKKENLKMSAAARASIIVAVIMSLGSVVSTLFVVISRLK